MSVISCNPPSQHFIDSKTKAQVYLAQTHPANEWQGQNPALGILAPQSILLTIFHLTDFTYNPTNNVTIIKKTSEKLQVAC